jgi:P pilus assembly chaperone PapD
MHAKRTYMRGVMAVIAGAVISMAVPARAANFAVTPMDVRLGRGERSQMIVISNHDNVPLRFQLDAYKWDERPDGQMVLTPTDDVIFFPQLFDLPPHGTQNIRVGTVAPAVDSEKTYRLVMHQLKSFEAPRPAGNIERVTVIDVLTNLRIPVFVEPPAPMAQASVALLTLRNGMLSFTVKNSGNAHFRIKSLRVEGFGAGPQPVFSKTTQGWYVLAGGSRNYELMLSGTDCSRANRLHLLVETDSGNLQSDLPIAAASCAMN